MTLGGRGEGRWRPKRRRRRRRWWCCCGRCRDGGRRVGLCFGEGRWFEGMGWVSRSDASTQNKFDVCLSSWYKHDACAPARPVAWRRASRQRRIASGRGSSRCSFCRGMDDIHVTCGGIGECFVGWGLGGWVRVRMRTLRHEIHTYKSINQNATNRH